MAAMRYQPWTVVSQLQDEINQGAETQPEHGERACCRTALSAAASNTELRESRREASPQGRPVRGGRGFTGDERIERCRRLAARA